MAVGDVVSGINDGGSVLNFQPAAGIECCITGAGGTNQWTAVTNGVIVANITHGTHTSNSSRTNMKIMINNTIYLTILTGDQQQYTGIQIK